MEGEHSSWQAMFVHWLISPSCTIHEQKVIESHTLGDLTRPPHPRQLVPPLPLSVHTIQTVTLNICTLLDHCSDNS